MKPGLSLRVSQHLALTPQLQQSIRLLQLSTQELSQEIEQMLDENPFLERSSDEAEREAFGLSQADMPAQRDDATADAAIISGAASADAASAESQNDAETAVLGEEPGWEGDGTTEIAPDDSEWGGDAPARQQGAAADDDTDATEWVHTQESLTEHLHRQALALRLSDVDRAALRFLIESLTEDGYLEDPIETLAQGLAGTDDPEQLDELVHHFTVALRLLQSLEPTGVGARNLAECLGLQLRALLQEGAADAETVQAALCICGQSLDLLARRDVRRLVQLCGCSEERTRAAMALITRLEPRPGRRFADVERNAVVPDVLVTRSGRSGQNFVVQLNPEVIP